MGAAEFMLVFRVTEDKNVAEADFSGTASESHLVMP